MLVLLFSISVQSRLIKKKVNNFLWEKVLHLPAPAPFETKEFKTQIFQVYIETHRLSQNSAQGQPCLLSIYMFSLYSSLDRIYPGTKVSLSSTHFFFLAFIFHDYIRDANVELEWKKEKSGLILQFRSMDWALGWLIMNWDQLRDFNHELGVLVSNSIGLGIKFWTS